MVGILRIIVYMTYRFSLSRDATTELLQCLLDVIGKTSTFVAFRLCLLLAAIGYHVIPSPLILFK